MKVSEGTYYTNPYWRTWADEVLASGKKLGLYHYAGDGAGNSGKYRNDSSRSGAKAQADYFYSQVKDYVGSAVLVLDWESENNYAYSASNASFANTWTDRVESKTGGVKPWVYLSYNDATSTSAWSKLGNPLWVAKYAYAYYSPNTTNYVKTPLFESDIRKIKNAICYQYTSCGRISGYGSNIDISKFFGSASDWSYWASKH